MVRQHRGLPAPGPASTGACQHRGLMVDARWSSHSASPASRQALQYSHDTRASVAAVSQGAVQPVIDDLVAGLGGHGCAVVLGSFGGREVVVLLRAGKLLVELSPLGGRRDVLVVLVPGYERRRGDPVDNLRGRKLHPRGAQVVQVAEHLSGGAASRNCLP